eukprot:CAMPEP_0172503408 /NCGR_PEP_ID=MMETSP1066-20121228/168925_1 /TAXON_ID=671091 /ORGANISM="Coscinodiscus wailesii, Strain CCMP2513" /LENGTH=224 /DNA_ID=CAMNT_0013279127 /DNA_START=82 /DNA_END=753 /DNA_ORIENTATION=+
MDKLKILINDRNALETEPFVAIHESNGALQTLVDRLQSRCEALERQILEQELVSEHDVGGGRKSLSLPRNEARLRDKLEKLQEQLNEKLQSDVNSSTRELKTANDLARTKAELADAQSNMSLLKEENDTSKSIIKKLTSELDAANARADAAEKQYDGLRRNVQELQTENDELKNSNEQLIGRFVSEKEKMVDQFNKMNEMVERLQKEVNMLRALQKSKEERERE